MKAHERILWVVALGLTLFYAQHTAHRLDDLQLIIQTYQLEANIQSAQVDDFSQQLIVAQNTEYQKGFEDGRTQAGVAFINGDSLYSYADGYHSAVSQFWVEKKNLTEDEALEALLDIISID